MTNKHVIYYSLLIGYCREVIGANVLYDVVTLDENTQLLDVDNDEG